MIKKYFKKLVSVALAAAMIMGMSVTAFANETPVTNNNETKITLNEYGHSQLIASINFSVGIGGGDASISFTTGTVIADDTKGSKVTS